MKKILSHHCEMPPPYDLSDMQHLMSVANLVEFAADVNPFESVFVYALVVRDVVSGYVVEESAIECRRPCRNVGSLAPQMLGGRRTLDQLVKFGASEAAAYRYRCFPKFPNFIKHIIHQILQISFLRLGRLVLNAIFSGGDAIRHFCHCKILSHHLK